MPTNRIVLHEIAHAWDHHNLTDEVRNGFLDLRNHAEWREGEWYERGAENAAEVLVWGLIDRPARPSRITQNSCAELLEGSLFLTGAEPSYGYTEVCS